MTIRIREKKLTLPGLFWDGERWVKAEQYPRFQIFTNKCLAQTLRVSQMTVSSWLDKNIIPFRTSGSYAIFDMNLVLQALKTAGYSQDENLKSVK